jgi:uncharacterized protein
MFTIPTYVKESRIHGLGVYTPHPIQSGTLIWKFDPAGDWKMTPEELSRFPEPFQSRLRQYLYLDPDGCYVLCGDSAKYMNHSDNPNCDDTGQVTIARRDIEAGEELTCDYRDFDMELSDGRAVSFEEPMTNGRH